MRFLYTLLVGTALTVGLSAQDRFGPEAKYDSSSVTALVDRVHTDLDHAYGRFHFSNSDRDRLNNAEKQLREFATTEESALLGKAVRALDITAFAELAETILARRKRAA